MRNQRDERARRRPLTQWAAAALALTLPLAACDGILDVTDPDIVTPENLESDIGLQTLRNGALGEFTLAYSGGGSTDGIIMVTGLITDEWMHSGTFTSRFRMDSRNMPNDDGTLNGVYVRLHRARVSLESTAAKLQERPDAATDGRIGEMLMYAGYTYIAFGENYCNGVPYSTEEEDGPPESNVQAFERALARFDAALAAGGVSANDADAARVGRGRALLNLGRYAEAATAVAGVADDFAKFHRHSSNSGGQRNSIFELNVTVGRWSLGDSEGTNGLDFRTSGDPRITSALCPGCAFDTSEQVPGTPAIGDNWTFANYASRDDPVRLATGIEARLIEAEAQLQAGDNAGWLATLNALRANWATLAPIVRGDAAAVLAPLADPGTTTGREDLHFRERAFWLFSTGSRLSDMRRLIRQYGRNAESVFPTGGYFKAGASFSTQINIPVALDEDNNSLAGGCTDRAA